MDIKWITSKFYSNFLDMHVDDFLDFKGIRFIETKLRDQTLKGYSCKYLIYAYVDNDKAIITYSSLLKDKISNIKDIVTTNNMRQVLQNNFKEMKCMELFEYTNPNLSIDIDDVAILKEENYKDYEKFFNACSPENNYDDWLKEYYIEKTKLSLFTGLYLNGRLVCVSDAPDMPFMEGIIQHTGITTLEQFRKKGYAKKVAYFAAKHLLSLGKCPQWETTSNNIASIKLAKSIGYVNIGEAFILEG